MEFSYSNLVQDPTFVEFYIHQKSRARVSNALTQLFSAQVLQCSQLFSRFEVTRDSAELDKYVACQQVFDQKLQRFLFFEEKHKQDMIAVRVTW